jgi:uncharacterized membrane protein
MIAHAKKRDTVPWVVLSIFLGPLVLIAILFYPKADSDKKAEPPSYVSGTSLSDIKLELESIKRQLAFLGNKLQNLETKINTTQDKEKIPQTIPTAMPQEPVYAESKVESAKEADVEINLGKFWLNKIGIVIFALGIAFLITYTFKYFGPLMKILFGYLVGGTLFFWGAKIEKEERFVNYGRVLLGGAWAIIYFTTYAMYHFEASRIINSQILDLFFLTLVTLGIIRHSLKYKSEALTTVALFIGYLTSTMGDISYFTLCSSALLAVIAVVLVYKLQWIRTIFTGIIFTYLAHFSWIIKQVTLSTVPVGHLNVENVYFFIDAGFLFIYWLLFIISIHFIKENKDKTVYNKLSAANFANFLLFFFMVFPKFAIFYPGNKFSFVLGLGSIYLILAGITEKLKNEKLFISNIIIAVSLLTLAVPIKFAISHTSVIWFVELPFLLLVGLIFNRRVFRYLSLALALVVFSKFISADFFLSGCIKIFGARFAWSRFLSLLGFLSSCSCFLTYRYAKDKSDISALENILTNFYSALATTYLTIVMWQVVSLDWLTFAISLEAVLISICGYILLDKYLRLYSLVLMAIVGVRFCFIDNYRYFSVWLKWFMVTVKLACAYTVYFLYRRLNRRTLLVGYEKPILSFLFFAATFLLVFAIFKYIRNSWISVVLGIAGVALFLTGFLSKDKIFRLGGFIIFAITLLRIVFVDLSELPIIYKIISFIILGGLFLGVSFIYTKYNIDKPRSGEI